MQRVEQNQQMRMSQLEAYIDEKFKFVAGVRAAKKETESVLRWNSEHTAKAIDKVISSYQQLGFLAYTSMMKSLATMR